MTTATRLDDVELGRRVTQELAWDPRVDDTAITARAHDGLVTLSGLVDSFAHRRAACRAAHRVHGVLDVVDELTVRPPIAGRSDQDVAHAVRTALEWYAYLPDRRIRSTVTDGWVVLEGDVDSYHQRRTAQEVVENLAGVRGVTNRIVAKPEPVDATHLKRSIVKALARRGAREARDLGVFVDGGTVTLSGKVRSWGEKNAIERAAGFARGVAHVVDRVVVDPWS